MITPTLLLRLGHIGAALENSPASMKQDDVAKYLVLKSELTNVEAKNILENNCCLLYRNQVTATNEQDPAKKSENLVCDNGTLRHSKFFIWL